MEGAIEDRKDMSETVTDGASVPGLAVNTPSAIDAEKGKKDYKNTFYALFAVGLLDSALYRYVDASGTSLSGITVLIELVILFAWCKTFNDAWKLIGKRNGWLWGLIVLIPYGVIIALLVAERTLSKAGYWKGSGSFKLSR